MDKRVSKTRDAIIDAYLELIYEKKDQKITISELAHRANIARKTFYLHYETLEDIMRDAAHRKIDASSSSRKKKILFQPLRGRRIIPMSESAHGTGYRILPFYFQGKSLRVFLVGSEAYHYRNHGGSLSG